LLNGVTIIQTHFCDMDAWGQIRYVQNNESATMSGPGYDPSIGSDDPHALDHGISYR
jgi:hypothetical protein